MFAMRIQACCFCGYCGSNCLVDRDFSFAYIVFGYDVEP